jgi:hypothetical protein
LKNTDAARTLSPERFMKVCGLSSTAAVPSGRSPRVQRPENFSLNAGNPPDRASASTTMKPTL